jgi:hypothetical protein
MNAIKLAIPLLAVLAYAPMQASATPLIGTDLAGFSVLAGGYASYGAGTTIGGDVGAVTYVVGGAGSVSQGDFTNTSGVIAALGELSTAQSALLNMGTGTVLSPTMAGAVTLAPGVYSASALTTAANTIITLDGGGLDNPVWVFNVSTYLVTGASTKVLIENAGANATILWNTGGYTALGASTDFMGTVLSSAYISAGAGSTISCGNTYAASYISMPAGANLQSSNCAGTQTWAGSVHGLGNGLDIVNGIAVSAIAQTPSDANPLPVPEPKTYTMLLGGLLLMSLMLSRRTGIISKKMPYKK